MFGRQLPSERWVGAHSGTICWVFIFLYPPLISYPALLGLVVQEWTEGSRSFLEGRSLRFNGTFPARQGDHKIQLI